MTEGDASSWKTFFIKLFLLSPPFPEAGALIFLILKFAASIAGIIVAIILYRRMGARSYKNLLARRPFLLNLGAFFIALGIYLALFFAVDSPGVIAKIIEAILFVYVAGTITLLIALAVLLIPWNKIKAFLKFWE
jgi:hypothetical protein